MPTIEQTIRANQTQTIIPLLRQILASVQNMETEMAEDFSGLTKAVADLQTEVSAIGTQMDTLLMDLKNAMLGGNQPAIDAATAALQAQIQALKDAATRDMPPAGP